MDDEDRRLFEAFVAARGQVKGSAEKAAVPGISPRTVRRYLDPKRKPPTRLEPHTRLAMARYLSSRGNHDFAHLLDQEGMARASGEGATPPPYNEAREEEELARIGGLPDALMRTLERESMAAVIRAQGIRDACRAARIEAEKAPTRGLPHGVSSDAIERAWKAVETLARLGVIRTSTEGGAMSSETREPPPSRPADETQ